MGLTMDVTLATERLVLRAPRIDDAPRIARLLDNFAIAGNLARVPYPYRLADARAWLRSWSAELPADETTFVLDLPGEGLVGVTGIHLTDSAAEIGYWLGEPFWNRGLMTEAVRAVVDWYFATSGAARLNCGAFAFNKASLAVQKKLGFTEIGTSMRLCLARAEEVRHIDTQLLRTTWAAASA
jgi:RimJ/RimL family protein N-acetyltransferase